MIKTVTAKNKYGTYHIPAISKHNISARTLLKGDVWEPETINFIRSYCTHDLIHAGTYFGDMLPAFSEIPKVWAFEPNKVNYQCALKTIESNGLTNITLMNVALGEESKTVTLMTERDRKALGGGSKVLDRSSRAKNQEVGRMGKVHKATQVPMVTIDETVPSDRDISVIHLDVELYELFVLLGARQTLERCSPYLILETHRPNPELERFLQKLGYNRYTKEKTWKENTVWSKTK